MASGPPNPRGPPDFQVFFKNKEGNSTVLKILMKQDELEARGPCGPGSLHDWARPGAICPGGSRADRQKHVCTKEEEGCIA